MADPTIPSFSTRFWSDDVGLADPDAGTPAHGYYTFGSGRTRFDNTLYDPRPLDLAADVAEACVASDSTDATT